MALAWLNSHASSSEWELWLTSGMSHVKKYSSPYFCFSLLYSHFPVCVKHVAYWQCLTTLNWSPKSKLKVGQQHQPANFPVDESLFFCDCIFLVLNLLKGSKYKDGKYRWYLCIKLVFGAISVFIQGGCI